MASLTKRCRHRGAERETCGCVFYIRRREAGRDLYTPVGNDRAAAERALARAHEVPAETVASAVEAWLVTKAAGRPNSAHTYASRAKHVSAYFGAERVRSLRSEDLARFTADLLAEGYAPATVQGIYACLTATLKHAQRRGVIRALPLPPDGPGIPSPEPREHAINLSDVEAIIARMPGVHGRVAELVLLTGLRWGEVTALEPGDVEGRVLRVRRTRNRYGGTNPPKTRAGTRVVPLSQRARAILAELDLPVGGDYRRAREALVHAMGPLHRPGYGWHALRNAHADLLDAADVSVRDQAARMGHGTNFAQTLRYHGRREAGSAEALDRARQHAASGPSGGRGGLERLDEARVRRRPSARG